MPCPPPKKTASAKISSGASAHAPLSEDEWRQVLERSALQPEPPDFHVQLSRDRSQVLGLALVSLGCFAAAGATASATFCLAAEPGFAEASTHAAGLAITALAAVAFLVVGSLCAAQGWHIRKIASPISYTETVQRELRALNLTLKEETVAWLILQHKSYEQIAQTCQVCPRTIQSYASRVYRKALVTNRLDFERKMFEGFEEARSAQMKRYREGEDKARATEGQPGKRPLDPPAKPSSSSAGDALHGQRTYHFADLSHGGDPKPQNQPRTSGVLPASGSAPTVIRSRNALFRQQRKRPERTESSKESRYTRTLP